RNIVDRWVYTPGDKATISVPVGAVQGWPFFILVGNDSGDQHQNSRFDVTLVDLFDANSGRDAGSDDSHAVDLQPGTYTGYLHANDSTDFYAFTVSPKTKYSLRVKPGEQEKMIDVEVLDRDAVKGKEAGGPNGGGG